MLGNHDGSNEYNTLGVNESEYEGIKEVTSLGFEDNIIDGDIL